MTNSSLQATWAGHVLSHLQCMPVVTREWHATMGCPSGGKTAANTCSWTHIIRADCHELCHPYIRAQPTLQCLQQCPAVPLPLVRHSSGHKVQHSQLLQHNSTARVTRCPVETLHTKLYSLQAHLSHVRRACNARQRAQPNMSAVAALCRGLLGSKSHASTICQSNKPTSGLTGA